MRLSRIITTLTFFPFFLDLCATSYTVTTNATTGIGSIRDIIDTLNSSGGVTNTITFNNGIGPIVLTEDLPIITKNVTLSAPVSQVIDGGGTHRLFVVTGNFSAINVTVTGGFAKGGDSYVIDPFPNGADSGGGGGGGLGAGGAYYIAPGGSLSLADVTLTNNIAQGGRGGDAVTSDSNHEGRSGGGASFSTSPNGSQEQGGGGTAGGQQGYNGSPKGDGGVPGGGNGGAGTSGNANPGANGMGSGGSGTGGGAGGDGIAAGVRLAGGLGGSGGGGGGSGSSGSATDSNALGGTGGGGGGFGGGGGGGWSALPPANVIGGGRGGRFGGNGGYQSGTSSTVSGAGGGGAGIGGAIFAGLNSTVTFTGTALNVSGNSAIGGNSGAFAAGTIPATNGQGFANDLFLYTGAKAIFNGTFTVGFSIDSDPDLARTPLDGGIEVSGGAVTFTSTNLNYQGPTNITAGSLILSGASSIFTSSGVSVTTPGIFNISSITSSTQIKDLSGSGSVNLGSKSLTAGTGNNTTFSGVMSGTDGSFTKAGAGILTLSGVNTYTGATTINAGTLALTGSGSIAASSTLNIATSGTFSISGITPVGATILDLSGSGSVLLGAKALTLGSTTANSTSYSGVIGGIGGSLNKTGTSTLTLSGVNTYSGGTTFTNGTLKISNDNNLGTGNLTFSGGVLQATANVTTAKTITLTATKTGTINVDSGFTLTANGAISGSGALIKTGAGTLSSSVINPYTGNTTINDGTLALTGPGSISASPTVTIGATGTLKISGTTAGTTLLDVTGVLGSVIDLGAKTLTLGTGTSTVFAGTISGAGGGITKIGAGTLTLSGTNVYTGITTFSGGTISASASSNLGTGSLTFSGGTLKTTATFSKTSSVTITTTGTIDVDPATGLTLSGPITGAGSLTKLGTGSLILTGINGYTGGTTLSSGILQGTTSSIQGAITNNASVIFDQTTTGTYAGVMIGTGTLTKQNSGTVSLTGANMYSGGTFLNGGILQIALDTNLGAAAGSLTFNGGTLETTMTLSSSRAITLNTAGTFDVDNLTTLTLTGPIMGAGSLIKTNSGTLVLSMMNGYTGGTTVNGGILQISNDNNLGGLAGNLAISGATLQTTASTSSNRTITLTGASSFDVTPMANTLTLSGNVNGAGSLTKLGAGTLILSGANSYMGGTNFNNGIVSVGANVNLGTGNLIFNGGTLQASAGFTTSRLALLNAPATIDVVVGALTMVNTISGASSLEKTGNGTLVLSGTNNYMGGTTISAGILNIASGNNLGTGDLTLNGGTLETTADLSTNITFTITGLGGTIDVNPNTILTISGLITGAGSLTKTDSGILDLTAGLANNYMGGTFLNGGVLKISSDTNLGNMVGALTFGGGVLETTVTTSITRSIVLAASGTFNTDPGTTLTISGPISGAGALTKTNTGTLILSNLTNNYMGGTFFNGGILQISSDNDLGNAAGSLTFNGGTLETTMNLSSSRSITLNTTGTFDVDPSTTLTLMGNIMGLGSLIKTNSGTLVLSGGANNYSGGTSFNQGIIQISGSTLGTGNLIFNGGTLQTSGTFSLPNNAIVNFPVGGIIDVTSGTLTWGGIITGGGSLTKTNAGTLILSGMNTYTGGTNFNGGVTSISSDANLGTGDLTFRGGTLQANGVISTQKSSFLLAAATIDTPLVGDILTMTETISGAFALNKIGNGKLILLGANTYSGGTTVSAGILQGDAAGLQGNILNNATVIFDEAILTVGSYDGNMSGTGNVIKQNAGLLFLTGMNTYMGGTSVNAGILGFGADTNLGTGNITLNTGTLLATNTFSTAKNIAITTSGTIGVLGGRTFTVSGVISGGTLVKGNSGTLALSGANLYTGGTVLNDGTLSISNPSALGPTMLGNSLTFNAGTLQATASITIDKNILLNALGGTFDVTGGNTLTLTGILSGAGSLTKIDTGTLILPASNIYDGGTFFNGGIVEISSDSCLGNAMGGLTFNGGTLQTSGTFFLSATRNINLITAGTINTVGIGSNLTIPGSIIGPGSLVKTGLGTLTLTGTNTYLGSTTISQGTLEGDSESLHGTIANSGTLIFNQLSPGNFLGTISNNGNVVVNGPGPLFFTQPNNYSGGTLINTGGDLQGNTASLQGDIQVDPNAFLTFSNTTPGSYSGALSGSGTVSIDASPNIAVTFSGNSSAFTGDTIVSEGILSVIGVLGGTCEVAPNGTLRGSGSVGTLINAGTLYPGASIATLTVMGDFFSSPTSTLEIEVANISDAVNVAGSTILNGALLIEVDPGAYSNQTYTIINSPGGITGNFSSFSITPSTLSYQLLINTTTVQLVISSGIVIPPSFSGITGNAKEILNQFLSPNFPFGSAQLQQIGQIFSTLSTQEMISALNKMGPAQFGALPILGLENNSQISNLSFDWLSTRIFDCCTKDTTVRFTPIGLKFNRTKVNPELPTFDDRTYGGAFTADYQLSNEAVFGGTFAYTHSNLHWANQQGHAIDNAFYLGPYATYSSEHAYLGVSALASADFYNVNRKIVFTGVNESARNNHTEWNFLGKALFGYRLFKSSNNRAAYYSIQPEVVLDSFNSWEPTYTEHGAQDLDLRIYDKFTSYFRSLINLKAVVGKKVEGFCFDASLNAGWMRTIPVTNTKYTAAFKNFTAAHPTFTVQSYQRILDQFVIGARISATKNCLGVSFNYEGNFGSGTSLDEFDLTLFYQF